MVLGREDVSRGIGGWYQIQNIEAATYICGFCGDKVSSDKGYGASSMPDGSGRPDACIRICPSCKGPTLFTVRGQRFPANPPGNTVSNVPEDLNKLYTEARSSATVGAYTGAVMLCRKMLMNIAVEEGAEEGKAFTSYVEYLADKGFVPPKGKTWVDYVRQRGNEANHEIQLMGEQDAVALITFIEMLLRFIYEFPNKVPSQQTEP